MEIQVPKVQNFDDSDDIVLDDIAKLNHRIIMLKKQIDKTEEILSKEDDMYSQATTGSTSIKEMGETFLKLSNNDPPFIELFTKMMNFPQKESRVCTIIDE
jgi:hypothetical protein